MGAVRGVAEILKFSGDGIVNYLLRSRNKPAFGALLKLRGIIKNGYFTSRSLFNSFSFFLFLSSLQDPREKKKSVLIHPYFFVNVTLITLTIIIERSYL